MQASLKAQRLKARIGALKNQHARLETSLDQELGRPLPDNARVALLKRMKLRTKDEISSVLGLLRTLGRPNGDVFSQRGRVAS